MFGLLLLQSLYFFLPAYVANMAPDVFRWIPFLGRPVHERGFGAHKTWRGLLLAVAAGTVIFFLQQMAYAQGFTTLALIDYSDFSILPGVLLGAGAILGDLLKSYFKRKQQIPPGKSWMPWDQLDFALGGLIAVGFVYVPPAEVALIILLLSPFLHLGVSYLGFLLGIKKTKF